MKNRIFFLTFIIALFYFAAPLQAKEEIRTVPSFSKIALRIGAKVYVEQGETQSVKVIADSETLEQIITEVKDRTLNIRFPSGNMFKRWDPGKIEIYITVPDIDAITLSGSGDIISEDIKSRILDLVVSGSGNIKVENLKSQRVNTSISGSGNINAKQGLIDESLDMKISGSGNINMAGVEANVVSVAISGSGNCSVNSNGSIKARISGSGSVYYDGNPSIDSSVSGSGKVKKR